MGHGLNSLNHAWQSQALPISSYFILHAQMYVHARMPITAMFQGYQGPEQLHWLANYITM